MPEGHEFIHGSFMEIFLFNGLETSTRGTFAVACIVTLLLSMFLEYARYLLKQVEDGLNSISNGASCKCSIGYSTFPPYVNSSSTQELTTPKTSSVTNLSDQVLIEDTQRSELIDWVFMAAGQMMVSTVSLLLMLLAMTMNIHVILCLASGTTIGKLTVMYYRRRKNKNYVSQ